MPFLNAEAQNSIFNGPEVGVPEPVQNLFNIFGKIKVDLSSIPYAERIISEGRSIIDSPENLIPNIQSLWNRLNSWLDDKIGVSFKEVIPALAKLFIWIFEWAIKLLKLVIDRF